MQYPIRRSILLCSLLFISLWLGPPAHRSRAANQSFTIATPPDWIRHETPALATAEQISAARDGVVYLLSDQQLRVSGNAPAQTRVERYYRHIHQVIATPGIEHVSQLELEFDPSYQQLVIHRVQIRRGAQTINALKPSEIRVLQKEDEIEQQLFNGMLAALVILQDVRVGDVVDYDYSLVGENPILAGRFTDVDYLVEGEPVAQLRYRLLWPTARPLQHQMRNFKLAPQIQLNGATTEYLWERANVPPPEIDSEATEPTDEYPTLYLSEFKSWQEVAAWAVPLYQTKAPLSPMLREQIERWRTLTAHREQQLIAVVRFVQDEIRYLGIELGPHSHLPHTPSQVFAQRYGDCKDKAFLLATILRELGIEADPALVNSDLQNRVAEVLPSPFAFDHVITRVKLNGQTYWFDPTISLQRGGLAQHSNPELGRALLVRADAQDLTEIPLMASTQALKTIREIYTVNADNHTATLEVQTTYRSSTADTARDYLAKNSLKDLAKDRLQRLQARDRSITALGLPTVEDDPANNVIVLQERYHIGRFWRDNARDFAADRLTQELPLVNPAAQQTVRLTFPLDFEQLIEIRTPTMLAVAGATESLRTEALQFELRRERAGRTLKLYFRLRTQRAFVSAAESAGLAATLEQIEDLSSFRLPNRPVAFGSFSGAWVFTAALLLSLPLLAFVAYKAVQARRQPRAAAFNSASKSAAPVVLPGSEPASPFHVTDEVAQAEKLAALRCVCGGGYQVRPHGLSPGGLLHAGVIYDGKRLRLVQITCARCQQTRDVYFALEMPAQTGYAARAAGAGE